MTVHVIVTVGVYLVVFELAPVPQLTESNATILNQAGPMCCNKKLAIKKKCENAMPNIYMEIIHVGLDFDDFEFK